MFKGINREPSILDEDRLRTQLGQLKQETVDRIMILASMLNREKYDSYNIPYRFCNVIRTLENEETERLRKMGGMKREPLFNKKKKEKYYKAVEDAKEHINAGFKDCFNTILDTVQNEKSFIQEEDILGKLRKELFTDEAFDFHRLQKIFFSEHGMQNYLNMKRLEKMEKDRNGAKTHNTVPFNQYKQAQKENIDTSLTESSNIMSPSVEKTPIQIDIEKRLKVLENTPYDVEFYRVNEEYKKCLSEGFPLEFIHYDLKNKLRRSETLKAECEFLDNEIQRVWAHVPDILGGVKNKDEILKKLRYPKNTKGADVLKLEKELNLVRTTVEGLARDMVKEKSKQKAFIDSIRVGKKKQELLEEIRRQTAIMDDFGGDRGKFNMDEERNRRHLFSKGTDTLEKEIARKQKLIEAAALSLPNGKGNDFIKSSKHSGGGR